MATDAYKDIQTNLGSIDALKKLYKITRLTALIELYQVPD